MCAIFIRLVFDIEKPENHLLNNQFNFISLLKIVHYFDDINLKINHMEVHSNLYSIVT